LRRYLRSLTPSGDPCGVPGCGDGRVLEDCCCRHSFTGQGNPANDVPNDGIIDWFAIDVAVRGLRRVRLSWVEKDIAVGTMLAQGDGVQAIQDRLGVRVSGEVGGRRLVAAQEIAEALSAR
jgi:hypothetical protein